MATLEKIMDREAKTKEKSGFIFAPRIGEDAQRVPSPIPIEKIQSESVLRELAEIKRMLKDLTEAVADLKFTILRRYMTMSSAEKVLEKRRAGDRIRQRRHKLKKERR